jgi:hypothetical protein
MEQQSLMYLWWLWGTVWISQASSTQTATNLWGEQAAQQAERKEQVPLLQHEVRLIN